jgi:hypothetical protein
MILVPHVMRYPRTRSCNSHRPELLFHINSQNPPGSQRTPLRLISRQLVSSSGRAYRQAASVWLFVLTSASCRR